MTGSIRIDTALAEQVDTLVRDFIQAKGFRGTVTVSRGTRETRSPTGVIANHPYYDVHYEGVLDILARDNDKNQV